MGPRQLVLWQVRPVPVRQHEGAQEQPEEWGLTPLLPVFPGPDPPQLFPQGTGSGRKLVPSGSSSAPETQSLSTPRCHRAWLHECVLDMCSPVCSCML